MNDLSRREFLKLTVIGAGVFNLSHTTSAFGMKNKIQSNMETIPKLNPGFMIKKLSDNEIELFANKGNGKTLNYRFTGFEADLFLEIKHEKEKGLIVETLMKKYNMTRDKCLKAVDKLLRNFESKKLIYYGEKMLVKIVEVGNARG
jgi:hypothetical protein